MNQILSLDKVRETYNIEAKGIQTHKQKALGSIRIFSETNKSLTEISVVVLWETKLYLRDRTSVYTV